MEALQKIVEDLEEKLQNINKEIGDSEKKIEQKNAEIQQFITSITNTNDAPSQTQTPAGGSGKGLAIYSMMMPFLESIVDLISKMALSTSQKSMIRTLQTGLSELNSAQRHLKEREWDIQNKLMDNQLQLAKLKIENGEINQDDLFRSSSNVTYVFWVVLTICFHRSAALCFSP